jgi:hypothetical protein
MMAEAFGIVMLAVSLVGAAYVLFLFFGGREDRGDAIFGALTIAAVLLCAVSWLAALAFPALRWWGAPG